MKVIEVPIINEDGSLQFTQVVSAKEAQLLLQFALNFMTAAGLTLHDMTKAAEAAPTELND